VYRQAFAAVSRIYKLLKRWPKEERHSLTDQIRRSSRSVCTNIAEAWRRRRYPARFVTRLSDADSEAAEIQVWLDFALARGCISQEERDPLHAAYENITGDLVKMMANPDAWCGPSQLRESDARYFLHTPIP
jgi:four helix bundle protein